ncbi:serpin B [Halogranum gelatinilyticum]|uniref:Serpin B n=1 Tax=Halogranum gelatinilyticum TaxID=660521 RepID=A0A1G9PXT7_9EURY|nr:serpin family protein [Halogranum gelatinilyticum]SDM03580.1 serpin B [Halogranum gelatinilyticum]
MSPDRRDFLALSTALATSGLLGGCLGSPLGNDTVPVDTVESDSTPVRPADVDADTLETLVADATDFAFDLHGSLVDADPNTNRFISPYSVSVALAMTYAGARGETREQMGQTLRFSLPREELHPAFHTLRGRVNGSDDAADDGSDTDDDEPRPFRLAGANALWGQADYPWRDPFLATLEGNYGAGLHAVDFVSEPEGARQTINGWVADRTEEKIPELLPEGSIHDMTRLVLTNAIYFKANWQHEFEKEKTEPREFTALGGSTAEVPTMEVTEDFQYAKTDGHQLVELPYVGHEVSMVVVLPKEGTFEEFEGSLDAERLSTLLDKLDEREGTLRLPKFSFSSAMSLKQTLSDLGMPVAFDPNAADFSGMADAEEPLFIGDVIHEAFVGVDEKGTEAAAATAVTVETTSAEVDPPEPFEMTVDRPFLFAIRHRETDAILFLGRVVDAAAAAE